LELRSGHYR